MHYNRGVGNVESYVGIWNNMKPFIDDERFKEVDDRLVTQLYNAKLWRKVCLEYFQKYSKMNITYKP